jgi:urate oxidase/2-oxo-4-hydroxy-4-carboxy-5-ureidoimidazoline decarboxylase
VQSFASGPKRHYYGKHDVVVYRLPRPERAATGEGRVLGANVRFLTYGDALWRSYCAADNTALVATDSMKNFVQRRTLDFPGDDLEGLCHFLGSAFLETYPHFEGVQVSASELPYVPVSDGPAFRPAGADRAFARLELTRDGLVEAVSGVHGLKLLRLGGSSFQGFIRDGYTSLPEAANRPLHIALDLEWRYTSPALALNRGCAAARVRRLAVDTFAALTSCSIQHLIHQLATRLLEALPELAEIDLEAANRTWDAVAEGEEHATYTDPRPPYGCVGLRLER